MEKLYPDPIGARFSPILYEISETLWEVEANRPHKPEYDMQGVLAAIHIFTSVMLDKMYELQTKEGMANHDTLNMANSCGESIRKLVKTYTGIDTVEAIKESFARNI